MNTLDRNGFTDAWRRIGATLPRPRAILAVSAHWFIGATAVTAMPPPARSGYIESVRGRGGGILLGKAPQEINIGALVRHTKGGFDLVDCGSCVIAPACSMTGVLKESLCAFLAVLDRYTLADLMEKRQDVARLLMGTPPDLATIDDGLR